MKNTKELLKKTLRGKTKLKLSLLIVSLLSSRVSFATPETEAITNIRIDRLDTRVSQNKEILDEYGEHIGAIDNIINEQYSNAVDIQAKTSTLEKNISKNQVAIKEQEEKIQSNISKINSITGNHQSILGTHENKFMTLEAKDTKHESELKKSREKDIELEKNIDNNKKKIDNYSKNISHNENSIKNNTQAINKLDNKIENLDNKFNQGMSLMAAMTAIDFQSVKQGQIGLGASVGHYVNSQGVAVGIAYAPTDDLKLNAKYSVNTGDISNSAIAVGATYRFYITR